MNRQHLLLGVLGVVGLANAGDWVVNSAIQGPLNEKRARTEALEEAIAKRKAVLKQTRVVGKQISQWQKQSLPSDPELARSLYRSWLHDRVTEAGLVGATVDSGSPANRRGLYATVPFSVRGRGTLQQFTQFMFTFSQASHLHRVENITLTPGAGGAFEVSLSIEALIVAGTKRSDRLSKGQSKLLASPVAEDYAIIATNNLFGIGYRDPLKQTLLTAVTYRNGKPLVWVTDSGSGGVVKCMPGERVELPGFLGTVVSATDDSAVFDSSGRQISVALGKSFAEAELVTP